MLDLYFNNKFLKKDLKVSIVKRVNSFFSNKNKTTISRNTGDGSLYIFNHGREDSQIQVKCNFADAKPKEVFRRIKHWLNVLDNRELSFTDDFDWYYRVVDISVSDLEIKNKYKGEFTITFVCRGWQYLKEGKLPITIENNYTIYNSYDISKPLFYIETGKKEKVTVKVTVNDKTFEVDVEDFTYIDVEREVVYKDKSKCYNLKTGYYPAFKTGYNTIKYDTQITVFKIYPQWREV